MPGGQETMRVSASLRKLGAHHACDRRLDPVIKLPEPTSAVGVRASAEIDASGVSPEQRLPGHLYVGDSGIFG